MPHIILECSDNILGQLDGEKTLKSLHEALASAGPFAMPSIKSRIVQHTHFRVGEGAAKNVFIHLSLAILPGRSSVEKKTAGEELFKVLKQNFPLTLAEAPHSLTLEVRELDEETYCKASTI
jgi:5-carboxymethyl-2-hydroxymuconate isomerase